MGPWHRPMTNDGWGLMNRCAYPSFVIRHSGSVQVPACKVRPDRP
jgi:hypothetical protein